jgi:hypothetical protein
MARLEGQGLMQPTSSKKLTLVKMLGKLNTASMSSFG